MPLSRMVLVFPEPCPPKAGSWCSCYERRPHVRLIVLGNGPRRANGLGPWIPKQLETFRCPRDNLLTKPSSCEVCSAYRGRDGHYWPPPAQIRTRPTKASGSYLRCLTSKRSSGQG